MYKKSLSTFPCWRPSRSSARVHQNSRALGKHGVVGSSHRISLCGSAAPMCGEALPRRRPDGKESGLCPPFGLWPITWGKAQPEGLCGQVSYVALSFSTQLSATNQRTERHISLRRRAHVGTSIALCHPTFARFRSYWDTKDVRTTIYYPCTQPCGRGVRGSADAL